jgi:hypothetical protein
MPKERAVKCDNYNRHSVEEWIKWELVGMFSIDRLEPK